MSGGDGRVRLVGCPGTVADLVAGVLALGGLTVDPPGDGESTCPEPDVVVLVSPGEAEWATVSARPGGVVLVTEDHPGDAEIVELILAGADAVIHPDASPVDLLSVVHAVRRGGTVISSTQTRLLAQSARAAAAGSSRAAVRLTPRERAILELAERGDSVKQTARALGVSPKTVENLQGRLFRKLGARNRAHAVVLAHCFGLLEDPERLAS